jgi:cyclic lactone autoinducer peptide
MKKNIAKGIFVTLMLLVPVLLSQACFLGYYQAELPQKPQ